MIDNLSDACKIFVVMVSKFRKFIFLLIGLLIRAGLTTHYHKRFISFMGRSTMQRCRISAHHKFVLGP